MTPSRQAQRIMSQAIEDVPRPPYVARETADTSARASEASADLFRINTGMMQNPWALGADAMSQFAQLAFGRFASPLAAAVVPPSIRQSEPLGASGVLAMSRALTEFAGSRKGQNIQAANALANCRTPNDLLMAQTECVRDNIEDLAETSRHIAEISMQMMDQAFRGFSRAQHLSRP